MSTLSQLGNRRLIKSRYVLLSFLSVIVLLTFVAYIDAYMSVFVFKNEYPPVSIQSWWFSLSLIVGMLASVIVAATVIHRPTWSEADSHGIVLIVFSVIIIVVSGFFDLASATYICILRHEAPFNWIQWQQWDWCDGLMLPRVLGSLQNHQYVMLNDMILGAIVGVIALFIGWVIYLASG